MNEIDVNEIKQRQIKILLSVHEYCTKNGLRYYLCGGSLLGAIRHKGYIPWDDDIDICMPRPDYEKFIREYSSDKYEVLTWKSNNNYIGLYTKVSDSETLLEEFPQNLEAYLSFVSPREWNLFASVLEGSDLVETTSGYFDKLIPCGWCLHF